MLGFIGKNIVSEWFTRTNNLPYNNYALNVVIVNDTIIWTH